MPNRWNRKPELLLLPNIPQPLHGVNPRTVLGSSWWDKERTTAYKSTNYHCEACGTHKHKVSGSRQVLEGHEIYDTNYQEGTLVYIRTTPLCPWCHKFIHDGRLQWLLSTNQICHSHYRSIISHGTRVLHKSGLKRPTWNDRNNWILSQMEEGKIASWDKWRLVINGIEYFPSSVKDKNNKE